MNPSVNIRRDAAFTLVELLVASAITILMVAFLGQVLISTTNVWRLADERVDAFRDARAAIQLMTNDLGRANINGDAQMLTLGGYAPNDPYASEAYAVTAMKNPGKSDLCAVGYYLEWDGTSKTYSLRRFQKDGDTAATSLAKTTPDFGTLYDRTTKGTTPETLASYVWDFELRPGVGANAVALGTLPSTKWQWIEIRFKAMSVKAGRKLQSIGGIDKNTWADPTLAAYKTYILPNEQQFVTRVLLQQNQ